MGGAASSFLKAIGLQHADVRMLMLGLDSAGKTTYLYKLKLGEVINVIPTIGFNVETIDRDKFNLTVWDVSGRGKVRALWRHYYQNTQGVIWMESAFDQDRLDESRDELHRLFVEDTLKDAVLCVIANKMDLPGARTLEQVAKDLELDKIVCRHVKVFACSALLGQGIFDPLEWIASVLGTPAPATPTDIIDKPPLDADATPELIANAKPGLTQKIGDVAPRRAGAPDGSVNLDVLGPEDGDEFLKMFAKRQVPTSWSIHLPRLRLIHAQLIRLGRRAAVKWLHADLKKLHEDTLHPWHIYHCTYVYFWIQMVDYFLAVDAHAKKPVVAKIVANASTTKEQATKDESKIVAKATKDEDNDNDDADESKSGKEKAVAAAVAPAVATQPATPSKTEFVAFLNAHPELLLEGELVAQYYSAKRILHEVDSFKEFTLPDIKPFPSLVALK